MESKKVLQTRVTKASQSAPAVQEESTATAAPAAGKTPASTKFSDISQPSAKMGRPDPLRFSEMEEAATGRQRLIRVAIFAAVIIVVGIGAILAIENANRDATAGTENQSSSSQIAQVPGYDISRTVLTDDEAGVIPRTADFTTAQLALGSSANANADAQVENVSYDVFSSLSRLTWELGGITSGFPSTSVSYDTTTNTAKVLFAGVGVAMEEMLTTVLPTIGSVDSISAETTTDGLLFTIQFSESIKYAASVNSALGRLTLDIKTAAQLNVSSTSSTSSTTSTSTTSSATSSAASAGQKLDNTFGQNAQTLSSGLANTVLMRNYFYQDFGPHFEFSWTFQGVGAESVPPKAEATYVTEGTNTYIQVKMEGVAEDLFQARSWSSADLSGVNIQYANILAVIYKGRENQVSTYWVQVKGQSDFRLHATGVRNDQQKVTLEIKD